VSRTSLVAETASDWNGVMSSPAQALKCERCKVCCNETAKGTGSIKACGKKSKPEMNDRQQCTGLSLNKFQ
jgi:hypothetical protein